jgi:hypothetical protein
MGDVRNNCDHPSVNPPSKADVEELIKTLGASCHPFHDNVYL